MLVPVDEFLNVLKHGIIARKWLVANGYSPYEDDPEIGFKADQFAMDYCKVEAMLVEASKGRYVPFGNYGNAK